MDSNIYLNQSVRIDLPTLLDTRPLVQANSGGQVGLTARGGAFGRYLSLQRNNGLIEVEGNKIKASETLFLR